MRIGIDPDIKGGIAAVRNDGNIALFDMPTTKINTTKGWKPIVDSRELFGILTALVDTSNDGDYRWINIEWVHATPQMGVVSAFKFGQTFGMIYGVAMVTGQPVRFVSPQRWKRRFGLIGKPKDESRTLAIRNYPMLEGHLKRKKDVGKADALWMALV